MQLSPFKGDWFRWKIEYGHLFMIHTLLLIRISSNSEAFASELLEMFPRYYMNRWICSTLQPQHIIFSSKNGILPKSSILVLQRNYNVRRCFRGTLTRRDTGWDRRVPWSTTKEKQVIFQILFNRIIWGRREVLSRNMEISFCWNKFHMSCEWDLLIFHEVFFSFVIYWSQFFRGT